MVVLCQRFMPYKSGMNETVVFWSLQEFYDDDIERLVLGLVVHPRLTLAHG